MDAASHPAPSRIELLSYALAILLVLLHLPVLLASLGGDAPPVLPAWQAIMYGIAPVLVSLSLCIAVFHIRSQRYPYLPIDLFALAVGTLSFPTALQLLVTALWNVTHMPTGF